MAALGRQLDQQRDAAKEACDRLLEERELLCDEIEELKADKARLVELNNRPSVYRLFQGETDFTTRMTREC